MKRILSLLLLALTLLQTLPILALAEEALDSVEMPAAEELTQTDAESTAEGTVANSAPVAVGSGLPELRIQLAEGLTLAGINAGSKDTKYPGNTVTLVNADGSSFEYFDVELKGRGNYTWNAARMDKKPYQIKFDSKTKVFGMDKAKKWVLLANHGDCTLMRNKLAFDLAKAMDMPYTPDSVWADVFVNDEYIGNYLVCEKNEVGSNRVPLKDDYGVLCEIDGNYGIFEDVYYKTSTENTVVVLSESVADDVGEPNSVSEAAFKIFCDKLDKFETLLYNDNTTWAQIEALIDVESFIKYYFIQELTEDSDGCRSSFYLWSDGKDDVIHLGPVWDYDISMGAFDVEIRGGNAKVDYTLNIESYMGSSSVGWFRNLFKYCEFDKLAVDMYNSEIKPVFAQIPAMIDGYLTDGDDPSAFAVSAGMNFERWNILGTSSVFGENGHNYSTTYAGEVNYLKNWLVQRVNYLDSRYAIFPVFSTHFHSATIESETDSSGASTLKSAATCTENEVYYKVCQGCGNVINGDTWEKAGSALGHKYVLGHCIRCGALKTTGISDMFNNISSVIYNIFNNVFSLFFRLFPFGR